MPSRWDRTGRSRFACPSLNHNQRSRRQFEKQTCWASEPPPYAFAMKPATSAQAHRPDLWAAGEAYEPYVGRWSRLVARDFIDWLALPSDARWLDVGCGTGVLTQTILAHAAPASVTGIDPSDQFIGYARRHTPEPRAILRTGNGEALPFSAQMRSG